MAHGVHCELAGGRTSAAHHHWQREGGIHVHVLLERHSQAAHHARQPTEARKEKVLLTKEDVHQDHARPREAALHPVGEDDKAQQLTPAPGWP